MGENLSKHPTKTGSDIGLMSATDFNGRCEKYKALRRTFTELQDR